MPTYKLSDRQIRLLAPRGQLYRVADGHGLSIAVHPNGSKYFHYRYRDPVTNKAKVMSLGVYGLVSLAEAREQAKTKRRLVMEGVDPVRARKTARRAVAEHSFEAIAREWYDQKRGRWKESYAVRVIRRLELEVFPWLGQRPVAQINAQDVLAVLRRLEARGVVETAHRVGWYVRDVFQYAIVTGRADMNPAAALTGALRPSPVRHMPAIVDPLQFGGLLRALDDYQGTYPTRCALQLGALTFMRPGELRQARWENYDAGAATLNVIAKGGRDHLVPLSQQAIVVANEVGGITRRRSSYMFPSNRTGNRPMSENTINAALRRLGYTKDEMTGHGFRAAARTMLDEVLGWRVEVIEMQLAHRVKDVHGQAYNRTTFLPERRQMMQAWADYLDELKAANPRAMEHP